MSGNNCITVRNRSRKIQCQDIKQEDVSEVKRSRIIFQTSASPNVVTLLPWYNFSHIKCTKPNWENLLIDKRSTLTFNRESRCALILSIVVFHDTSVLPFVGFFNIFNLELGELFGGFHEHASFILQLRFAFVPGPGWDRVPGYFTFEQGHVPDFDSLRLGLLFDLGRS